MTISTKEISAIKKDAADKNTTGGLEHSIVRWLGYSEMIIPHAGGKVPEYLAPTVAAAKAVILAVGKKRAKTKAKTR